MNKSPVTLAWTGASGAQYGLRLLQVLLQHDIEVHLLISKAAQMVLVLELDLNLTGNLDAMKLQLGQHLDVPTDKLSLYAKEDWMSPLASGSGAPERMVICPCTTGTLASIATGSSDNLIERAADVVIKEKGELILVVREMPLSQIHLKNMLSLAEMGAVVMPASPGFYNKPLSVEDLIDFVVDRVLKQLKLNISLVRKWGHDASR